MLSEKTFTIPIFHWQMILNLSIDPFSKAIYIDDSKIIYRMDLIVGLAVVIVNYSGKCQ